MSTLRTFTFSDADLERLGDAMGVLVEDVTPTTLAEFAAEVSGHGDLPLDLDPDTSRTILRGREAEERLADYDYRTWAHVRVAADRRRGGRRLAVAAARAREAEHHARRVRARLRSRDTCRADAGSAGSRIRGAPRGTARGTFGFVPTGSRRSRRGRRSRFPPRFGD